MIRKRLWTPIHDPTISIRTDKAGRQIPTIHIPVEPKGYPFGFGMEKAKAIIINLVAILEFVQMYGSEEDFAVAEDIIRKLEAER
jgi:hypothetical protein